MHDIYDKISGHLSFKRLTLSGKMSACNDSGTVNTRPVSRLSGCGSMELVL